MGYSIGVKKSSAPAVTLTGTVAGTGSTSTYSAWVNLGTAPFRVGGVIISCVEGGGSYGGWSLSYGPVSAPVAVPITGFQYDNTGYFLSIPLDIAEGTSLNFQASDNATNTVYFTITLLPYVEGQQTIKNLVHVPLNGATATGWLEVNTAALPTLLGQTKGIVLFNYCNVANTLVTAMGFGLGPTSPPSNIIYENVALMNTSGFCTIPIWIPYSVIVDGMNAYMTFAGGGGGENVYFDLWLAY